jgi:L-talarate/galactarate dehydratase
MKISGIRSSIVALPADEPLAGAAENPNGTRPIVTLEVQTDDGAVGVGATYFGGALTGTLKRAVEELGALCVGEDPARLEAVTAKLRAAAGSAGPGGIFNLAHSALDTALWDLRAKAMNLPLCAAPAAASSRSAISAIR